MTDLVRAKQRLVEENLTLVLVKGDASYTSESRGIGALLQLAETNQDFRGYSAADTIVGRAAALLYVALGVSAVYAKVISEGAIPLLNAHGIALEYGEVTEGIVNRTGSGPCPMEATVSDINTPEFAIPRLREKLNSMMKKTV